MPAQSVADTRAVVEATYAAWAARDLDGTLAHMADDCTYTMHVPTEVLAYGGAHHGKTAIAQCLKAILEDYGFVAYAVDWLAVDGENARAQVVYYYSHTESGVQLDGRFRHVWRVAGGKVVAVDEYHDVAKLKAFLDMVQSLRSH